MKHQKKSQRKIFKQLIAGKITPKVFVKKLEKLIYDPKMQPKNKAMLIIDVFEFVSSSD